MCTKIWRQDAGGHQELGIMTSGVSGERTRLLTVVGHLQASNISSILVFLGKAELNKQKESRMGNQADVGLIPIPRTICSKCSTSIC